MDTLTQSILPSTLHLGPRLASTIDYQDDSHISNDEAPSSGRYWWLTSGKDLERMLQQANYSEQAQEAFLCFYRDVVCPQLGPGPDSTSAKSSISWDGNPFEYSFDLKGSGSKPKVRIAMDLTQLRPINQSKPLCIATSQRVLDWLSTRLSGFDDTCYRSLLRYFDYSHLPTEEQNALIQKVNHRTSMILGFDIDDKLSPSGGLSGLVKVYFTPCIAAAVRNISRWQAVQSAILDIPSISSSCPNIVKSLGVIEDFLSTKPEEWKDGARFLATDFTDPLKARFKIYMRCLDRDFDSIWDFYTLGGRISGMEEDKPKIRDFMKFISKGREEVAADGQPRFTTVRSKATYIYFSLSAENPVPAPKLGLYASSFATDDMIVVKGIDQWMDKYGWSNGGRTMEQRISTSLPHRNLGDRTGIFTFVGIGRKEGAGKTDLSIQTYLTPELYDTPRISPSEV